MLEGSRDGNLSGRATVSRSCVPKIFQFVQDGSGAIRVDSLLLRVVYAVPRAVLASHATATYPEDRTHRIPFWLDILSGKKDKMSFIEAYMVFRTFEIPSVGRKNLDSHLLYTLY